MPTTHPTLALTSHLRRRSSRSLSSLATAACLLLLAISGCGAGEDQPEMAEMTPEALSGLTAAMSGIDTSAGPPMSPEAMADLLPDELAGLPRTEQSSQTAGAMGFQVAIVTATYEGNNRRLELTLTDYPAGGPALAAANAWTMSDFSRETASGYERTTVIDGYRGFESFQETGRNASISAFVANRVVFAASARGLSMDELHEAVSDFGLQRIDRLATAR